MPAGPSSCYSHAMPKALIHDRHGEPADVLRLADVPAELPGAGEVVLRMEAAAMHVADIRTVQGMAGFSFPLPRTPGFEGVGRVLHVGPGVDGFAVGDRAFPPSASGTFREELCVPAAQCMPAPEGDAAQLSLLTINGPTAWILLHGFTDLQPGDWLVQNGANSSCGRYLVSLAREAGVRTVNVVRRMAVADELTALGADVVLADGPGLAERVREATGGAAPKLGVDCVAGAATQRIAECLAPGSQVICYGAMSGAPCELDFYLMFRNDLVLRGISFRRELNKRTRPQVDAIYQGLAERIADGRLQARSAAAYPLAQWREAFAQAARTGEEREGKVILVMGGD
ncbi:MAG TPA: zinc-dependent alcohol dehydrogenase family protein [Rubrivivax sp.]|nr:zinc-dependent alcohol dehydrogenase family protein [Rubrivivax sp.]